MEKTIKENKNPLLIARISMKVLNQRDGSSKLQSV